MSDNNLSIYTEQFKIYADEVDMTSRVRITSILDFLQNTAWMHYNEFERQNGKILPENMKWVVLKIGLKITKIPCWHDKIKIKTWAPFVEKYFAYRNFEILDEGNNIIGNSTFNWAVIDINSRKPASLENFINKWHFHKTPLFFELKGKIEKIIQPYISREISVNYSDIDVNNHANNAKYIQWIIDCIDCEVLKQKEIKYLEVNFLAEAFINDRLIVNIQRINDNEFSYRGNVIRKDDNKELCRAKFLFT
jgi:acyl-ACP thioesterase